MYRNSPHLLMRLHGPEICSLLLFWQPLIPLTSLSASIGPYLKQQRVGYAHILPIVVTDNRKERGASNIGIFRNKNKHNISPMIILMPLVYLAFSTTSESLNSPSSADTHRLHYYHRNAVAASTTPQPKPPHPKSDTIATTVL